MAAQSGEQIAYREEIQHPALLEPTIATGTMALVDGVLVKDQKTPKREISEIDQRVITVRKGPGAEANLLPLPDEIARFANALRALMSGSGQAVLDEFAAELMPVENGWKTKLSPLEEARLSLDLVGCGARLTGMTLYEPDGVTRRLTFATPE